MRESKITPEDRQAIKTLYTKGMLPFADIAERFGVSRQTVATILGELRVDTSKRKVVTNCAACNNLVAKTRAEYRKHARSFCDSRCYNTWLRSASAKNEFMDYDNLRDVAASKYEIHADAGLYYCETTEDIYIFPTKEKMLEWKRTGLPAKVLSFAGGNEVTVEHRGGK